MGTGGRGGNALSPAQMWDIGETTDPLNQRSLAPSWFDKIQNWIYPKSSMTMPGVGGGAAMMMRGGDTITVHVDVTAPSGVDAADYQDYMDEAMATAMAKAVRAQSRRVLATLDSDILA